MLGVGCSGSGDENNASVKTIKIGCLPITHSMPLYVCADQVNTQGGDYKIEVVKFTSWPELVDALRLRKIDGANILVELAMRAMETGSPLKMASLSHRDGNVVIAANDIGSASDLRGKTIAVPHKMSPHTIMLDMMLEEAGVGPDEVTVIDLSPAEMSASLSTGSISAYLVAEPFGALAVVHDTGKVLAWSNNIYADSACCAIVFNQNFVDKNGSLTDTFIQDYEVAAEKANAKDDTIKNMFSEITGVETDVLDLSFEWISYDNLELGREEYSTLVDYIKKYDMMENPPAYEDFVYIKNEDGQK